MSDFVKWDKIHRLNRDWEITEKIDGTNGVLHWTDALGAETHSGTLLAKVDDLYLFAGSRNRWLSPVEDNYGFAKWAAEHAQDLVVLGPGRHFGEWYGKGVNRGYGLEERRFALFNTKLVAELGDENLPPDVDVVPVLATMHGSYLNLAIDSALDELRLKGSVAVPGFMNPEGVVVKHSQAGNGRFKVLLVGDDIPKGVADVAGDA